jgi:DNA-binding HxlR family transcriptional regulator
MNKRSYNQYCSLAYALDRIGERWTLLLIRQLMSGPKRFKDLLAGLPGMGTNLLAARLKQLESDGLIAKLTLPPPAGSSVYELTAAGRGLSPALVALARWGTQFMGRPGQREKYDVTYAVIGLQVRFNPVVAADLDETYQYVLDGTPFYARIKNGKLVSEFGEAKDAVYRLTTDSRTFMDLAAGLLTVKELVQKGKAEFEGDWEALMRSGAVFSPTPKEEELWARQGVMA